MPRIPRPAQARADAHKRRPAGYWLRLPPSQGLWMSCSFTETCSHPHPTVWICETYPTPPPVREEGDPGLGGDRASGRGWWLAVSAAGDTSSALPSWEEAGRAKPPRSVHGMSSGRLVEAWVRSQVWATVSSHAPQPSGKQSGSTATPPHSQSRGEQEEAVVCEHLQNKMRRDKSALLTPPGAGVRAISGCPAHKPGLSLPGTFGTQPPSPLHPLERLPHQCKRPHRTLVKASTECPGNILGGDLPGDHWCRADARRAPSSLPLFSIPTYEDLTTSRSAPVISCGASSQALSWSPPCMAGVLITLFSGKASGPHSAACPAARWREQAQALRLLSHWPPGKQAGL